MDKVVYRRALRGLRVCLECYSKHSENNGRSGVLKLTLSTESKWWPNTDVRYKSGKHTWGSV